MTYCTEEQFTLAIHHAAHAWRRALDRRLRDLGLGRSGWMAVSVIARSETPLSQVEISTFIGVEGATMVTTLDRLEKSGLVQRVAHQADRRVKLVSLTDEGRDLYNRLKEVADRARDELLAGISKEEMNMATMLLDRVREMADRIR
ncbi:MAG TPA: MarR family transcriptional regulator [Fluviicoccus sp.]|jgi:MarR family transcriptional regulator for hemolysin|nr:MarR family transcriptional regulator [Fluviicoccus sp.]